MVATVCLSDERAAELVGALPDGLTLMLWDGGPDRPPGLDAVQFWTPSMSSAAQNDPAADFAALPALRVVQLISAGVDAVARFVPAGVTLCDGRGVHGGSTSEWVLAVILAVQRELPRFVLAQGEHRWDHDITGELAGQRVLVVGAGDLGEQTARRLRAFDAEPVLVARTARPGVHGTGDLPDLLPGADIVVLVIPKTAETIGLVDARFLARMRDGALLVNASRGPIVVTADLVAELASGRLRAALDVTDPEPLPADHPLWALPNVLITPHVGGAVRGYPARAYRLVADQIRRFAAGEPLINVVEGDY